MKIYKYIIGYRRYKEGFFYYSENEKYPKNWCWGPKESATKFDTLEQAKDKTLSIKEKDIYEVVIQKVSKQEGYVVFWDSRLEGCKYLDIKDKEENWVLEVKDASLFEVERDARFEMDLVLHHLQREGKWKAGDKIGIKFFVEK